MEHTTEIPYGWLRISRAHPMEPLKMSFAIKQKNINLLQDTLLQVSDPTSPQYGHHLSMEQVHDMVAPAPEHIQTVYQFLKHYQPDLKQYQTSPNGDFINVIMTVSTAERLLNTHYYLYEYNTTLTNKNTRPITAIRCHEYSLPTNIASLIDFVAPTLRFPLVRRAVVRPSDLFVTPEFLRGLYAVGDAVGTQPNNVQAISSFLEQYFSADDLQTFFKLFQNTSIGHTVAKIVGDNTGLPGTEAELDIQYIMSVGAGVPTWAYYTAGRAPTNPDNEPFLVWLQNVTASQDIPYVFSVSYGEDEKSVGYDYASRINIEFMKLGLRGVSIMFASGDDGAGGNCTASNGRFNPNFPAGSPWVTAVGGVFGGNVGSHPTGEIADSISGGGFSDWWPTPSYQQNAVKNYLNHTSGLPEASRFNHSGRGYPDVAAQSENFLVVQFGLPLPVAGTSCAAPTFSGIVGLLNDVRLKAKKTPLGFLNPLLYHIASGSGYSNAFNDITQGSNDGCGPQGFPAATNWDPVTGVGSPNYTGLSQIVASLP